MAAKPSQPALYEKMRTRVAPSVSISPKVDVHPVPAATEESPASWLGPGRAIRLPTGYVLLGCGIVILLLSVAYMMGHRRGTAVARSEFERVIQSNANGVNDPLGGAMTPVIPTAPPPQQPANTAINRPASQSSPGSWGPVAPVKDPRQKGLNYFIIAETNEQGASALAEFCRIQGLETYVVLAKNDRRRVIAFPGFEARDRTSPQVKALEAKIHSVGDLWKKNKGSTDLRDAYPSLYNG